MGIYGILKKGISWASERNQCKSEGNLKEFLIHLRELHVNLKEFLLTPNENRCKSKVSPCIASKGILNGINANL